MQQYIRYGCISILLLLSNHALAQQHNPTLKNLPQCALPCADEAALANGCETADTSCLCTPQVLTAIVQCSISECKPAFLKSTEQVLRQICTANSITTTSLSTTSQPVTTTTNSISHESSSSSITTTNSTSTSQTSQTSSTSAPSSTTPDLITSASQTTTELASSTFFTIQTVIVTPTSSAAGRLDVSIGAPTLVFGLPSLLFLVLAL